MRVLFIPAAVSSHHLPMVPLAWGFQSTGHEVAVAAQPPVVDDVTRTGLIAFPVGGSYELLAGIAGAADAVRRETGEGPTASGDMSGMSPQALRRYVELRTEPHVRAAEAMGEDLVEFVRYWRPDVVVTDPITMAAPLAAAAAGAPLVHHLWGPQPASLTQFPGYGLDPERWPAELRELYLRHGVEPRAHHGIATVDPGPPSLQPAEVPNKISARYMAYNGSGAVPEWLRSEPERERVCVSWVNANTVRDPGQDEHPLAALLQTLAERDLDTVVAVRAADREGLGTLPPGVRLVEDIPLGTVFRSCAAAVNHGGTGTTLTAMCNGVPQVIAPFNPGLVINSDAFSAAGAAIALPQGDMDTPGVVKALDQVLSEESFGAAARRLREENLAQRTPAEVVAAIEALL